QHHRGVRTLRGRVYYCRPVRLPVDMPGQHWFGNTVRIFAGVEAYRQPPGVPGRDSIRCTTVPQSLQLGIPQKLYQVKIWQGDPCAPQQFIWSGVNCTYSSSGTPRVTSLNLYYHGLNGAVPNALANLKALNYL
ncbi:unnamed protein product, partial [Musa acuminata var. zebrina]